MNRVLKTLSIVGILALAQGAFAVTGSTLPIPAQMPDLQEQVESTITPQYPNPGDKVTITLEAYGTDLNRAVISWSINDVESISGKGQRTFTVIAGALGTNQTITATILPVNGPAITKVFYINPQSVDIVWQANTYTPPFYRGKALFTPETTVTFVAMPNLVDKNGVQVSPNDVTYKWRKDFVVQGRASGYGIRTFSYKGDILMQPVNVGLEASIDGGNTAISYTDLAATTPIVELYEESPLYGILWNRTATRGLALGDRVERNVIAVPFFLGVRSKNDPRLAYRWSINGSSINVPTSQNTMTFRNSDNLEGYSQIGITVENSLNFLEGASNDMTITFNKSTRPVSL